MQRLLTWLDQRFHRWSIPHLPAIFASVQATVLLLCMVKPELFGRLWLRFSDVLAGEHYRLVTFLALPPGIGLLAFLCISFGMFIGTTLEAHWGTFRFNLYILIGTLTTLLMSWFYPEVPFTNGQLMLSQFLAFAWLYPDYRMYLMMIYPVQVRYLAYVTWGMMIWGFVEGAWEVKLAIVISIANYLVFFADDILARLIRGKRLMDVQMVQIRKKARGFHRCVVCGITEKDDRDMEFRYCSQCTGDKEYCSVHLRNHDHA